VVGTVTLPSIGTQQTDHVSLGRGVMMQESTLLTVLGLPRNPSAQVVSVGDSVAGYTSTVAIDVRSQADARALADRIAAANPDGTPGGTYRLGPQLGAPVVNASQMGSEPVALAAGVAAAAVLALALTVLASVRERRRDLALLKALGLRGQQIRAMIVWQTTVILVIAVIAGVPLGIAAGRWAWTSFANAIGVVPATVVPSVSLLVGVAALLVGGNLLASLPARLAVRIAPAAILRTE
jgi:predicted lysophospholipase L1 biosynthesis ABC-type transport system permease subunit